MSSAYQINFVLVIEFLDNVSPEEETSASWADSETWSFVWITPHEIAHCSIVGNFLLSIDGSNLIERGNGRTETSVNAEDFVVNDGSKSQVVEYVGAVSPDIH